MMLAFVCLLYFMLCDLHSVTTRVLSTRGTRVICHWLKSSGRSIFWSFLVFLNMKEAAQVHKINTRLRHVGPGLQKLVIVACTSMNDVM